MDNRSSVGNASWVGNSGPNPAPRRLITAEQVAGVLKQAQAFQTLGRYHDAIDLCEQILQSGFARPDIHYFLGWLYQEQQRWGEAVGHFQALLDDPNYALSSHFALGQCYRSYGDLQTAAMHFDKAIDSVNLDALTLEESDQLVQLCEAAAETHSLLGEQEQVLIVCNGLIGFLRSRGWDSKVAQVESMSKRGGHLQATTQVLPPSAPATPPALPMVAPQQEESPAPVSMTKQLAAVIPFPVTPMPPITDALTQSSTSPISVNGNGNGELPYWLKNTFSDTYKSAIVDEQASSRSGLNFELLLLQPDLPTLYDLLPFAQINQVGVVNRLTLTRESVLRGLAEGINIEQILQFLEARSQRKVPRNVAYTLHEWAKLYKETKISQVYLLEVSSEAVANEICDAPPLKELEQRAALRRLGPCFITVSGDVNLQELRRILDEMGILARIGGTPSRELLSRAM